MDEVILAENGEGHNEKTGIFSSFPVLDEYQEIILISRQDLFTSKNGFLLTVMIRVYPVQVSVSVSVASRRYRSGSAPSRQTVMGHCSICPR